MKIRNVIACLNPEIFELKREICAAAPPWMQAIICKIAVRVVRSRRGRASYSNCTATVPLWAWQKGREFAHYYLSHELAHHVAHFGSGYRGHGEIFQAALQRLTPYAYFELGYKPKLAKASGITAPRGTELVDMRPAR